ncbi:hypothetical protein JCM10212_000658 [Sporobolomyces blumeae]
MESIRLAHAQSTVHVALYTNVENASTLRQRLIHASTLPDDDDGNSQRQQVDFAFIDAAMITSRLHLLTAVHQAILADARGALKSKTLHSEVIWMLDPGTNISEALKHFGMSANTRDLLLVRIQRDANGAERAVDKEMRDIVEGQLASLDLLGRLPDGRTNEKSLRKVYKLNGDAAIASVQPGTDASLRVLDELVTSLVALKSVM